MVVVCGVRFILLCMLYSMIKVLWCGMCDYVFSFSWESGRLVVYSGCVWVYGFFFCMLSSVIFLWVSRVVCMLVYVSVGIWVLVSGVVISDLMVLIGLFMVWVCFWNGFRDWVGGYLNNWR